MCGTAERELGKKIQELIAYVHTLMSNYVDIFDAWKIVKDNLRWVTCVPRCLELTYDASPQSVKHSK